MARERADNPCSLFTIGLPPGMGLIESFIRSSYTVPYFRNQETFFPRYKILGYLNNLCILLFKLYYEEERAINEVFIIKVISLFFNDFWSMPHSKTSIDFEFK